MRRGGAVGLDVWTSVLVVGCRGGAQELTVPTRWQAVRAKPVKSDEKKKVRDCRQLFEAVLLMEASSLLQAR